MDSSEMNESSTRTSRKMATTLAAAFIAMSVAVLVVSGGAGILFLIQTQKEAVASKQQVVARQAADAVAGFVREKFNVMEAAVKLTRSNPERERAMQVLLGMEPAFRQLVLLNPRNDILFRVSRMSRTESKRLDDQLGPDPFSSVVAGDRHIGSVYVDQVTSEPLVVMSVPVATILGDIHGILVAEVNLKFIWELVDRLRVGETGHAYVVDRRGRLIAFGDTGRVLRGETLEHLRDVSDFMARPRKKENADVNTFTGIAGNRVVGTYVSLGTPDWAVMTELPVQEAYRQVIRNGAISAIILLAMSALAGMSGVFLARRLSAPIVDLTRTAARISEGELDVRAEMNGPAEVLHLSAAFNEMTRRLGVMLNQEVERTRMLEREISRRKKARKALEESDSILRATLESTHDGVLVADRAGHISHYNRQFARIWSIPDDRLAAMDDKILIDCVLPQVAEPERFAEKIEQLYQSPNPSEDTLRLKDGRILERFSYPLIDRDRENGRVWFFRDVTERKRAEEALKESGKRLEDLTDNVPGVVIQFRATRDHIYTNEFLSSKVTEIFGLEKDSATVLDEFYARIPDAEKEAYADSIYKAVETVSPWTYEGRFHRPDGDTIWFSGHAIPQDEGDTIVYYGILRDITRRKEMETSLRFARFIIDKADIAIFILGENGKFLDVNEEACRYLGYSYEELCKMDIFDVDTNFTTEGWSRHMADLRSQGVKTVETQNRRKDGTVIPVQVIDDVMTFEDREFHVAFVQDISERKKAEEALRNNEKLLSNILESMNEGVIVLDREFKYQIFNTAMEIITDTPKKEVFGKKPWDVFPFLKDSVVEDNTRNAMEGGAEGTMEIQLSPPGKSNIWLRESYTPLKDDDGRIVGVIEVISDITRQKRDEEEVRRLRNYLSNIIDSMPSVIVAVDCDGNVTLWNSQTEQATGTSFEKARARPLTEVFPRLADEMKLIETSIRERRVISSPRVCRKLENETRFEDVTIFPLVANGVEGAVIRADDVTDQVRMEEMIVQSEKMLSVGGLAAGMAHEINNPLAGILQTASVLRDRLGNPNIPANLKAAEDAGIAMESIGAFMQARGIPRMLAAIDESGRRVAEVVENMLGFARKSEATVSSRSLEKLLDKTLALAATDYDLKKQYDFKKIDIRSEYADDVPLVPCEGAKIQQVLLNILRNGAQAMQTAGIETPRFVVRTRFDRHDAMAVMEIQDNGPGMEEAVRKRVFEPFFTTKPPGVGTGLGLSVSYFIITENHGGEMEVASSPGHGTTFVIRLPVNRVSHG